MEKEISNEEKMRFNSLYQQIIEIACGNFMFRQEPSGRRDPLDTIGVLLNMMSEEIYNSCFKSQQREEHPEFHFSIFLNDNYHITSYTSETPTILKWDEKKIDRPVSEILSNNSVTILKKELESNGEKPYQRLIALDFLTENKGLYRTPCTIQKMTGINSDCSYVITAFRFKNKDEEEEEKESNTAQSSKSEKKESAATKILLKQVRLYILRNLHTELPSLKELGLIHRTNKTKLKEEFKKMYGTTIPRFHMEKRLEKGALLIRSTELPISIIMQRCGFKDHSHFSKNFRLQYGQTPSQYRKENTWSIQ
ncbi:AraC family transcriptional regulator [Salegentibacter sp. JZCK2]|uniref:helix-turn-helix domain-containing protein n=1 Tax=Salegentibacter tibetensis TaxID=2873600 RepID=UPI001CC9FAE4|nr:AraC family transcriptional regulator [Salegentibacter tibetensis]MBZ9731116.1 AraC family transcriptional regulator [Salegentibacter tibetensis]